MVAPARIANFAGLSIIMVALSANIIGLAALPTINSVTHPKLQEITGKLDGNGVQSKGAGPAKAVVGTTSLVSVESDFDTVSGIKSAPSGVKTVYSSNNAEKLKRGLTSFMNNLNPAPYFVPPSKLVPPKPGVALVGAQSEPATIVHDGSSAQVVIKGPNRLVQARQLGGPLRWGRR